MPDCLSGPATIETDIPRWGGSVLFFRFLRAVHSRMAPRPPCRVASMRPRLGPGVSTMRSIRLHGWPLPPRRALVASRAPPRAVPPCAGRCRRRWGECPGGRAERPRGFGQLVLPRFDLAQARDQGAAALTVFDERNDLLDLLLGPGKLLAVGRAGGTPLAVEPVGLLRTPATFQPSRPACSRQPRNWSSMDASRCRSDE